jgi:hypothetical protein
MALVAILVVMTFDGNFGDDLSKGPRSVALGKFAFIALVTADAGRSMPSHRWRGGSERRGCTATFDPGVARWI